MFVENPTLFTPGSVVWRRTVSDRSRTAHLARETRALAGAPLGELLRAA